MGIFDFVTDAFDAVKDFGSDVFGGVKKVGTGVFQGAAGLFGIGGRTAHIPIRAPMRPPPTTRVSPIMMRPGPIRMPIRVPNNSLPPNIIRPPPPSTTVPRISPFPNASLPVNDQRISNLPDGSNSFMLYAPYIAVGGVVLWILLK